MTRLPIGTFINIVTVTIGSLIGLYLQQAFPDNIKSIVFQAIGLIALLIGIQMSLKIPSGYLLLLVFSLILGGILGEVIHLDDKMNDLAGNLQRLFRLESATFSEGLITAFLLFCVGSITIVGAIEEGIRGNRELLLIKSLMDGITSIALASTYGIGVLFSIFPMLIVQGGITVVAGKAEKFFTPNLVDMISATGGVLIIALGFRLLDIGTINIENLLPGLVVAGLAAWIYEKITATHES